MLHFVHLPPTLVDLRLPLVDLPLPFVDLPLPFVDLSLPCPDLPLPFVGLQLPFVGLQLPFLDLPLPSVDLPLPCPDLPLSARLQAAQYDLLRQLQADAITAVNVAQVSCRATISSSLQRSISVGAGGPRILSAVHDKASENGSI